jgi:hypothetical protein
VSGSALFACVLSVAVQRIADHWLPPGTESTFAARALGRVRDMLNAFPVNAILFAGAVGALFPYLWDERKRLAAAIARTVSRFLAPWTRQPIGGGTADGIKLDATAEIRTKRPLSSYQTDLKLAAIKPILDLLRTDMQRLIIDGRSIRETAWAVFQDRERYASYQVTMENYRADARYNMASLENVLNKTVEYPDVIQAAKPVHSHGIETAAGDFTKRFAVLMQYVGVDLPYGHFMELMEPAGGRLYEEIDALGSALTKAINALVETTKKLSE